MQAFFHKIMNNTLIQLIIDHIEKTLKCIPNKTVISKTF